jgi:hypothetical protein
MEDKLHIGDFIDSKCEAVNESEIFVHDWIETNGNPCSICYMDRSECCFYKEMVER